MADMLSQEEIDALLGGGSSDDDSGSSGSSSGGSEIIELLTAQEKDALGEIGNISMGTAATTLFTLLSQKVNITTPRVSETTINELIKTTDDPFVTINIQYKVGIEGINLLIIDEKDVKIITDLMMGGDGTNTDGELTDLHLSAIGEAMNQMIGSSSTSLSEMLGKKIDISPPEAISEDKDNISEESIGLKLDEQVAKISFRMTVGDLIDSEIMQLMPIDVAKQLVDNMMKGTSGAKKADPIPEPTPQAQPAAQVQPQMAPQQPVYEQPQGQPMYEQQPAAGYYQVPPTAQRQPVNAQPIQFQNFGAFNGQNGVQTDISLIQDVPLEITVELGRTMKKISEILDFTPGTVVELERLVGEALDILANGKRIARGEVVVVDENYGIRITEIIVPEKRLSDL